MKKLLCIFLLAMIIGCGKENSVDESKSSVNNIETVQQQEKSVESVSEKTPVKEAANKDIEPKIIFSNDGIILPAKDKKIAFRSINVKKVNLKIKKVYENNTTQFLQEFIFKGNGNIFDYGVEDTFDQVGDIVFEKDYDLDYEKNIWKQNEIELGDFVDTKGLFILELTFDEKGIDYEFPAGTDSWKKYSFFRNNGRAGKAVLLSHMGITAQKETEQTVVCVMDILKNTPVKNAEVKLISVNNQVLQEGKTDSRGEIVFKNYHKMMYVLAEKDGERSILKFRDSQLSYDGFAVEGVFASKGIQAFIYTDRGIYRPGDEVHISFIARNNEISLPENHPVTINIYSPTGKKFIENAVITESKNGFYTYSFKTNLDSETGIWRAEAQMGSNKFIKDISVETVVPYKIKVETKVPEKLNINENKNFKMSIEADYLFGAPGKNLRYTSDIQIREESVNFEKFRNYVFKNPTSYAFNSREYAEGKLNEEGKGELEFDISKIIPKNLNLIGIITTRVMETNGRPVIKMDTISINKFDSYVGIKIPEDTYIKSGDKLNLEVIAVDNKGENLISGKNLTYLSLIHI